MSEVKNGVFPTPISSNLDSQNISSTGQVEGTLKVDSSNHPKKVTTTSKSQKIRKLFSSTSRNFTNQSDELEMKDLSKRKSKPPELSRSVSSASLPRLNGTSSTSLSMGNLEEPLYDTETETENETEPEYDTDSEYDSLTSSQNESGVETPNTFADVMDLESPEVPINEKEVKVPTNNTLDLLNGASSKLEAINSQQQEDAENALDLLQDEYLSPPSRQDNEVVVDLGRALPTDADKRLQELMDQLDDLGPPPPLPPRPIDYQKIQEVRNLASQKLDPKKASQHILSKMITDIQQASPGCTVTLTSELVKTNGQCDPEPFTHAKFPGQTLYKSQVQYTLEVVTADGQVIDIPTINSEIFTTAETKGQALAAIAKFKDTVTELAKFGAGLECNLDAIPNDKRDAVMNQRSFLYQFSQDPSSGKIGISSIQAGDVKLTIKRNESEGLATEYAYNEKTGELRKIKSREELSNADDFMFYATEEEALLNIRHDLTGDNFYQELEQKSEDELEYHLKTIKTEIKQKEAKLADIKKIFKDTALFTKKETNTKGFNRFLAGLDPEKAKTESSPLMQSYLKEKEKLDKQDKELRKELQLLQNWDPALVPVPPPGSDLEKLITKMKAELKNNNATKDDMINAKQQERDQVDLSTKMLRKEVEKEQATFTSALTELQNLNKHLIGRVKQLEEATQKANSRPPDNETAKIFLKAFTDKEIKRLNEHVKANQKLIDDIRSHLPVEIQRQADISSVFVGVAEERSNLNKQAKSLLQTHQLQTHQLNEAATKFEKALKINPNDFRALTGYANVLSLQKKPEEAKRALERAVAILMHHGNLLRSRGKYAEAVKYYNKASKRAPNDVSPLLAIAETWIAANNPTEARNACIAALGVDRDNPLALNQYIKTLRWNNETAKADRFVKTTIGRLNEKASDLANQKKYAEAIRLFEVVLKIDPKDGPAQGGSWAASRNLIKQFNDQAEGAFNAKDYAKAVKLFDSTLKIDSTNKRALIGHGNALVKLGMLAEAEASYKKLLDGEPDNVRFMKKYGDILLKQNQPAKFALAKQFFTKALSNVPNDDPAYQFFIDGLRAAKTGLGEP